MSQTSPRLPPPPAGQTGWPWADSGPPWREGGPEQWPRISIVTPSFNQGRFIEATIRSILLQGYPNLEYIVIDGGSTDNTVNVIRKYEPWIGHWVSEPDRGMYDAINKGFAKTTGEIMAWSNSDDVYLAGALHTVGSMFRQFSKVEWATSMWKVQWDGDGNETRRYRVRGFDRKAFFRGRYLCGRNPFATHMIQQQSTFWRESLWERSGGHVDAELKLAGDFELWARFYHYADLYALEEPIGVFRSQPDQKTARLGDEYLREAEMVFRRHGGSYASELEGWMRQRFLSRLPSSLLAMLPGAGFRARVIARDRDSGEWSCQREVFA